MPQEDFLNSLDVLERAAAALDRHLSDPCIMGVHPAYGGIKRDVRNPPYVLMSAAWHEAAKAYNRTPEELLRDGPDEFTTLDGITVKKTATGYRCPYPPAGLIGPGRMGVGWDKDKRPIPESRAVDMIPFFRDPAGNIRILGGFRGDTGQACFIGGFAEGNALSSIVKEFFEEGVSGSLHLAPEQLEKYHGDDGEKKAQFLLEHDAPTVRAVADYFRKNLEVVYKGPVLADPSRTDDRWVGTTAYSGIIRMEELNKILAESPFHLSLSAGSDLKETAFHTLDIGFATTAFSSHGPMACIALARVLREEAMQGRVHSTDAACVQRLITGIRDYLDVAQLTRGPGRKADSRLLSCVA